jgi:hypothetical protein
MDLESKNMELEIRVDKLEEDIRNTQDLRESTEKLNLALQLKYSALEKNNLVMKAVMETSRR